MNETLTVFMISEIERLKEEGREPARRIYHNMLRTLRESAGKEEIGFEEVSPVFLDKYEHWLLGKRLSWNTVSTYMRALRAGYNRGMKGRPGYVTGLFDKVYTGTRSDVKRAVSPGTVGRMIRMAGEDAVALGTDFDGFERKDLPEKLEGAERIELVWDAFQKAGITSRQTEKIAYGNLFRVIEAGCGKTSVS